MTLFGKAATRLIAVGAAVLLSASVAWADFEAGNQAYAKRDYDTAFKEWYPLAEAGDAQAQNNIGFMYRKGRGVPPDEPEAIKWYRRAADQGFADAMTNLGYMYDEGRTIEQDFVQSYKWFLLATERGRDGAEGHLKLLEEEYMTPEQVEEAKALAANWQATPEIPAE